MRLYQFKDIVGNTNSIRLLKASLQKGALPKVVLMKGYPGTGKSTAAEICGLSLTCLNPKNGEPCLECKNCKQNLKALKTDGVSPNLIKKNLGKLNSRKDVLDMIKEIFVLKSSMGNNVYILEEAHTLRADDQTSLLEEIDRLDENTYIIICTTEAHKIIAPLRSRAISFDFNRLNNTESKLLFARTCKQLNIKTVSKETSEMIIKYSKGVPRDMVNLIDFIHKTAPTPDEIAEYLGFISSSNFTNLFLAMSISSKETALAISDLMQNFTHDVIIEQLKEYVLDALFYVTGNIKDSLTSQDTKVLDKIFDTKKVMKLSKLLENVSMYNTSETDLKFLLFNMSLIFRDKRISDVYKDNSTEASKQSWEAKELHKENVQLQEDTSGDVKKLDKSQFMNHFKK